MTGFLVTKYLSDGFKAPNLILSQKVCASRIRTNVPTPGYNIQSLFRILAQHTVALRCAESLELPQNGFLQGNQTCLPDSKVSTGLEISSQKSRLYKVTRLFCEYGNPSWSRRRMTTSSMGPRYALPLNPNCRILVRNAKTLRRPSRSLRLGLARVSKATTSSTHSRHNWRSRSSIPGSPIYLYRKPYSEFKNRRSGVFQDSRTVLFPGLSKGFRTAKAECPAVP